MWGPQGKQDCFDGVTFTFERCCPPPHCFRLAHCCAEGAPCGMAELCCRSGAPCMPMRKGRPARRGRWPACHGEVWPPPWLRIDEGIAAADGASLSLQGALTFNGLMQRHLEASNATGRRPVKPRLRDRCIDEFEVDPAYGLWTVGLPLPSKEGWERPTRAKLFSERRCDQAACVMHAARLVVHDERRQARLLHYVVTAPRSCGQYDVALRLLPRLLRRELEFPSLLTELHLQRVERGDPCMDRWRPSVVAPMALTSVLLLPFAAGLRRPIAREPTALDAVRLLAVWRVYNEHTSNDFPFRTMSSYFGLGGELQERLEDIFYVLTVRLLSFQGGNAALAGRLLRKVTRQFLVALLLISWLPTMLHAPSPTHCLNVTIGQWVGHELVEPFGYMRPDATLRWAAQLLAMRSQEADGGWCWPNTRCWPTFVWAYEVEMKVYLLVGLLGLCHMRAPRVAAAVAVAYLAWTVRQCWAPDYCERNDEENFNLYSSLKLGRLPNALVIFYANEALRRDSASWMPHPERWLGARGLATAALLASWLLASLAQRWRGWDLLSLPGCGDKAGVGSRGDCRFIICGLPFQLSVLACTYLPGAVGGRAGTALRVVTEVTLPLQLCHRLVFCALSQQYPNWVQDYTRAKTVVEQQWFFAMPMLFLNVALAFVVHHLIEAPWMALASGADKFPRATQAWAVAYVIFCLVVWRRGA